MQTAKPASAGDAEKQDGPGTTSADTRHKSHFVWPPAQPEIRRKTTCRPQAGVQHERDQKPQPLPLSLIRQHRGTHQASAVTVTRLLPPGSPPPPGCLLPGPARSPTPFHPDLVTAKTARGAPAWWCKYNKLVIADGMYTTPGGTVVVVVRTSRCLALARKKCEKVTVVIDVPCGHCRRMLGKRREWRYETTVCHSGVCRECRQRALKALSDKQVELGGQLRLRLGC